MRISIYQIINGPWKEKDSINFIKKCNEFCNRRSTVSISSKIYVKRVDIFYVIRY
jgi:hypothetical protein